MQQRGHMPRPDAKTFVHPPFHQVRIIHPPIQATQRGSVTAHTNRMKAQTLTCHSRLINRLIIIDQFDLPSYLFNQQPLFPGCSFIFSSIHPSIHPSILPSFLQSTVASTRTSYISYFIYLLALKSHPHPAVIQFVFKSLCILASKPPFSTPGRKSAFLSDILARISPRE